MMSTDGRNDDGQRLPFFGFRSIRYDGSVSLHAQKVGSTFDGNSAGSHFTNPEEGAREGRGRGRVGIDTSRGCSADLQRTLTNWSGGDPFYTVM